MNVTLVGNEASYTVGAFLRRPDLRMDEAGALEVDLDVFFFGVFLLADFVGVFFFVDLFGVFDLARAFFFGVFFFDDAADFFFADEEDFLAVDDFLVLLPDVLGEVLDVAAMCPSIIKGIAISRGNHTFMSKLTPATAPSDIPLDSYPSPWVLAVATAPASATNPAPFITFK